MNKFSKTVWKLKEIARLGTARVRSKYYKAIGCKVASKCLFGKGIRIDRPWTTSFGKRCVIEPNVWFDTVSDSALITVGDYVFFGTNAHIMITDSLTIGDHCLIGDGVIIADHKHNTALDSTIGSQGCNTGPIVIGSDVLICVRAVILQGITIGDGAIIGPGAIVSQNVPANAIVGTAPGRILGQRQPNRVAN